VEFYGTLRPRNRQSPYWRKPIPFAIRKNGYLRWDATKLWAKSLPDRDTIVYRTLADKDKDTGKFKIFGRRQQQEEREEK